jgi:hypothetical protein
MSATFKSYNNPDFPVTSFVYALHCDIEYSRFVVEKFKGDPKDRSPLAAYDNPENRRKFPKGAVDLVYEYVPADMGGREIGKYNPKGGRAAELFLKFMLPELTSQGAADEAAPQRPPTPAFENSSRPLLSCLGQIFVNNNPSFVPPSELPADVVKALKLVRRAPNGRPFLSAEDALLLLPMFVDELTLGSPVW